MQKIDKAEFMGLPYIVEVEKREGRFFLVIPELSLVVSADDIATAFEALDRAKQELFEKHQELDRLADLPMPKKTVARAKLKKSLMPFFIKAATVAVVGAMLIGAANISIIYTLQTSPKKLALYANRVFTKNFVAEFDRLHREEMTPEKKAQIRAAIRSAIPILKPYAQELRPLFETALEDSKS
ncbi:MAG: hypothetical protein HQ483_06035 [Rhodospirillales bacterium]|nr:hypothetical protein [Rhodospirillales bacterium]